MRMIISISCLRRFTNPPIGEALAADVLQNCIGSLLIRHAEGRAVRVTEGKLFAVALKVRLGNVVVRADDTAFEQTEERFNAVRMDLAAHVFAIGMVHHFMPEAMLHEAPVRNGIGEEFRAFRQLRLKNRLQGLSVYVRNMERARAAIALDQRKYLVLLAGADEAASGLGRAASPAVVGFVGLNDLAAPAEHSAVLSHGFADAVAEEPSRFVGHTKHAVELVARDALLTGRDERSGHEPLMERNLGALENGPDRHRVLLVAMAALVQAWARAVFGLGRDFGLAIRAAAVRAYRAVRPAKRLKVLACGVRVFELGLIEYGGGHG